MVPALKSEFRKLFTVRSTYIMLGVSTLLIIFYAFYIVGWRATTKDLHDPSLYSTNIVGALSSLPVLFGAIIAMLLMTHEYRYNTIMHTLTSSNSRSKVLGAKFLTISVFALVLTAVVAVLTPVIVYLGVHAHGNTLVAQSIDYHSLVWRILFYGWGYIVLALLLAALIRNQIGAIVSLFAIPTAEQLLALLLKKNSVYLPFSSLNQVLAAPTDRRIGHLSPGKAALVFGTYLAIGWLVTWVLFLRRDAN
jgi:ABC-2 type transport system permease protein